MTRSIRMLVIILAIAATHAPRVAADPTAARSRRKQPNPKELNEARAHFKAAEAAKARGEYQTAAVEYLAAYQLFEEPEFLFDTAEVYRLAGDEQDALIYCEKYLEIDPGGRGAVIARSTADQLRHLIAASKDAAHCARNEDVLGSTDDGARRNADDGTRHKANDDRGRKAEDGASQETDSDAGHPGDQPPGTVTRHPGHRLRVAGIAAGGLGVVALGIGAGFGFKARSLSNQVSMASVFDRMRYDQGRAAERDFVLFGGVGAAVVAIGATLYYLGERADRAAAALTLAPVVAPSRLTVTLSGRF